MQRADAGVTALIPVAPGPPPPSISAAHNCNLSGGGGREGKPTCLPHHLYSRVIAVATGTRGSSDTAADPVGAARIKRLMLLNVSGGLVRARTAPVAPARSGVACV